MNAFTRHLSNIARLGVKELWSLWRDPMMLVLILYLFTVAVYSSARAIPETLHLAAIAVVDEDRSPLSQRIVGAFYPPLFTQPAVITRSEMDAGMDTGDYTFVLNIPPNFQRDVLAGRAPAVQRWQRKEVECPHHQINQHTALRHLDKKRLFYARHHQHNQ